MSIATEITRLRNAKEAIKTSIINKEVTVPDTATIDEYSSLIDSIQQGSTPLWAGGGNPVLIDSVEKVKNLANDTTYNSITPSTNIQTILTPTRLINNTTLNTEKYDYVVIKKIIIDLKYYDDIPSDYKYIKRKAYEYIYDSGKMYYVNNVEKVNNSQTIFNQDVTLYNNGASGETFTNGYMPYGISTSGSISPYISQSGDTPIFWCDSEQFIARANTAYMQVEAFDYLDAKNSNIFLKAELYQVDKGTAPYLCAKNQLIDMLNAGSLE